MKLTQEDTDNLKALLTVCTIGGIESFIIENGIARGLSPAKNFAMISGFKVPKLPYPVGILRVTPLIQRLNLFETSEIEVKDNGRGEVNLLEIISGKSKAQYRCTSTQLIKAPKSIDDEHTYTITINKEENQILTNAIKVMGGEVQIVIKRNLLVTMVALDKNNDEFTIDLADPVEVNESIDSVVFYYDKAIMHTILKTGTEGITLKVGALGSINTQINGHQVTILPTIKTDQDYL
jgi:hypothetical protein